MITTDNKIATIKYIKIDKYSFFNKDSVSLNIIALKFIINVSMFWKERDLNPRYSDFYIKI